jgi:hypothetical protein
MAPPKRKEAPASEDALADAVEAAKRKADVRTRSIWAEDPQARTTPLRADGADPRVCKPVQTRSGLRVRRA